MRRSAESRSILAAAERAQAQGESALAIARGWRVSRARFGLEQLAEGRLGLYHDFRDDEYDGRLIDHPACFRLPYRPYRPIALLSYSYVIKRDDHVERAKDSGLAVEFLDESWYGSGTIAALYIRI